jgi:hypothetical protein
MVEEAPKRRSAEWELVELRHGKPLPELLEEGLRAGKSLGKLAREWRVGTVTIQKWANELGYRTDWVRPDGTALR